MTAAASFFIAALAVGASLGFAQKGDWQVCAFLLWGAFVLGCVGIGALFSPVRAK